MSKVDTTIAPYYNDYDELKRYYSILFRSGRAVQVRELIQLQTMLQTQVARFGSHMFKEGSVVIPGELNYDLDTSYAKIELSSGTYDDYASLILAKDAYVENDVGVRGVIVTILPPEDSDPSTVYVKYTRGDVDSGTQQTFSVNDTIYFKDVNDATIIDASVTEVGKAATATISEGIYFVRGTFCVVLKQSVVLDKYNNVPSCKVGLEVQENIVTFQDDTSMLDNNTGTTNFAAPGADRLQINLVLDKKDIDEDATDFVELLRINNGKLEKFVRGSEYSVLNDTLARRTYDESGDYVVDNFDITLAEHLNTGTNGGLYDDGDNTKFVAQLDPGTAYVNGYRIETVGVTNVDIDKARSVGSINNAVTSVLLGNYVVLQDVSHVPQYDQLQTVALMSAVDGGGVSQGTARVRGFEKTNGEYRLYIFDIRNTSNVPDSSIISSSLSVKQGGFVIGNKLSPDSSLTLQGVGNNSLLFKLPFSTVKTLKDNLGNTDSTYTVTKFLSGRTNGSGSITFAASGNDVFTAASDLNYTITNEDAGGVLSASISLGGVPTGREITLSGLPATTNIRVAATVVRTQSVEKTKTLTTTSFTGTPTSGFLSLKKADIYKVKTITDNTTGLDVTGNYTWNSGRKSNYYDIGYVYSATHVPSGTITVTFDYFAHGAGDYFTVDSYGSVDYADIPEEVVDGKSVSLADIVDFRPRIDDNGATFTGTGASLGLIPKPYTLFRSDFDYYLNRVDAVYVNANGEFACIKGVPAVSPALPALPHNVMHLYTLTVPAYTKSVAEVLIKRIDNRRYTMRDIGMLESRVRNLEYYTTLSLLEKDTNDLRVVDASTGLDRFKNGFLVDAFTNHDVGDMYGPEYKCSVDAVNAQLRPQIAVEGVDMGLTASGSTNYRLTDDTITLPYSEVVLFSQPYATRTMNVNPYAVFSWSGNIKLTPSKDSWVDTRYTHPIYKTETEHVTKKLSTVRYVTNTNNSTPSRGSSSSFTNAFNFWNINWSGIRLF